MSVHSYTRPRVVPALVAAALGFGAAPATAPRPDAAAIRALVDSYKRDPMGPYATLRWFCPDSTTLPPQERCPTPGGIQHAVPRAEVRTLAANHHVFLGQILAGTPFEDFLDEPRRFSRAKQYQMERFLQAIDDGWIQKRARSSFRGAFQAEDEEAWSRKFLQWLAARDDLLAREFYFVRQLARDLPRADSVERSSLVRGLAAAIADEAPAFVPLRIKIHGQPDRTDLDAVRAFRKGRGAALPEGTRLKIEQLEREMEAAYASASFERFARHADGYRPDRPVGEGIRAVLADRDPARAGAATAALLWTIRKEITAGHHPPTTRVSLLLLSNEAEELLLVLASRWPTPTLKAALDKAHALAQAAAGTGALEVWEWEAVEGSLGARPGEDEVTAEELKWRGLRTLGVVQWGAGMVRATYRDVTELFGGFEPKAGAFVDDQTRSSILLPLGESAARIRQAAASASGLANQIAGATSPGSFRGLNPGAALGDLVVVPGASEGLDLQPDKIYVLGRAPADLKPVAGILTLSEGNAVSHVQLLARNLGIPNAVLTETNIAELLPLSGTRVFLAVSPAGAVVLKRAADMTEEERAVAEKRDGAADDEHVTVPTDRLALDVRTFVELKDLRSSDSGRLCGPKAANLGQLGFLFPGRVAPGLVLPFGVFRAHLEQPWKGGPGTYWDLVQDTFREVPHADGTAARARLQDLFDAIRAIPFLPGFEETLLTSFREALGGDPGQVAVFVRSDTNMEDLKDFTGAGLNLTVPNVRGQAKLFQAIRDVWASPFTERSYRWRQRVLTNPADVYPSVLLLPTQNVEKSGVLITSGMTSGKAGDTTVAFNWGQGGAVDGQAAEAYLLREEGDDELLFPARQPEYNLILPEGGIEPRSVDFSRPILGPEDRQWLRTIAADLRRLLPGVLNRGFPGPFDMELGFVAGGVPRFLQVRPFVENRRAWSSPYLRGLDQGVPRETRISLGQSLPSP
jgi:hypothetical protein